jgi:hypothetical protein
MTENLHHDWPALKYCTAGTAAGAGTAASPCWSARRVLQLHESVRRLLCTSLGAACAKDALGEGREAAHLAPKGAVANRLIVLLCYLPLKKKYIVTAT